MPPGSGAASGSGFQELAGYIFGGNQTKQNMEMTTPVFNKPPVGTREPGKMQFVMERRFSEASSLPKPKEGTKVESKVEEGGVVAAYIFSGWPFDTEVCCRAASELFVVSLLFQSRSRPLPLSVDTALSYFAKVHAVDA